MLTPEGAMKFGPLSPARGKYDFFVPDMLVKIAENNAMAVRGHTLVWHASLPRWLVEGRFSRDELIAILDEHVHTVVEHFRGRVVAWDVVNEAIAYSTPQPGSIWQRGIGTEYIDMAFRWAHEADPQVHLFYNDSGGEGLGRKSDTVYNLIKGLKQRGVPIHGVGLQMHVFQESPPSPQDVAANMKRLAALGLEIHITEMDVGLKLPVRPERLAWQARVYGDTLRACLSVKDCKAFVMWGFTDRYSWIPEYFRGYGSALIFDDNFQPKPAYHALMNVLAGH